MYSFLYGCNQFKMCTSVKLGNEIYLNGSVSGSKHCQSVRSPFVLDIWCGDDDELIHTHEDLTQHPGQTIKFLEHSIIMDGNVKSNFMAQIAWFKHLEDSIRHFYGKPVEVWHKTQYEQECPSMFIPVQRIKSKFVYATDCIRGKDVIIVCPRDRYIM